MSDVQGRTQAQPRRQARVGTSTSSAPPRTASSTAATTRRSCSSSRSSSSSCRSGCARRACASSSIFEGRDAAGKGGTIKRVTEALNPRVCRVVALPSPTDREQSQWYFQRYVEQLPAAGEIVLFDRSWYNRAGVERVMGFATAEQVEEFFRDCPEFERMLIRSGITLVKYWFSVSDEEQDRRFQDRLDNPLKRWKFSEMDLEGRDRWEEYSRAKDEMFKYTDTKESPWWVVDSNDKKRARLNTHQPPAEHDPLRGRACLR